MSKIRNVTAALRVNSSLSLALFWLWLVHVSGAIGIAFQPDFFLMFTPFNLLLGVGLLLFFQPEKSLSFYASLVAIGALAWGVEVAGVATGKIFGEYSYGENLGSKVLNVPLLIGVLWAGIIAAFCNVVHYVVKVKSRWLAALLVATAMVFLDLWMEVVAPPFDFWFFGKNDYAPLQNFVAWWLLAFVLTALFFKPLVRAYNPLALTYTLVQLVFFVLCVLLHHLA
jgi:bisanhydrobacterioruberin hydratase